MKNLVLSFLILFAQPCLAGIIELGYSFSRTESQFDADNFSRSLSHTASLSWYFMQMSALELSYTKGEGQLSGKPAGEPDPIRYRTSLEIYGADLVVTLAAKDWSLQPYVKGGMAWVDKTIYRLNTAVSPDETAISQTDKKDPVPSLGVGFRFKMTEQFNIKASYDRWRSGTSGDTEIWDSALRAGVSFLF